ncbi:hypothetical protein COB47_0016 [Caldicellulosiruptor obsidiansis OB47]|uniref:Uncharacterized protein n=1 Tax=Caldicellulosiruptor obsidiansis (strain ATCC BAA-2073 / JCM 16842 / OB47) TaxID=608506 RepID=D9TGR0_CALOO|nr:hypothetical protein COB47_0016 [Caldicellulosiruptor obsidiansis OB47]
MRADREINSIECSEEHTTQNNISDFPEGKLVYIGS